MNNRSAAVITPQIPHSPLHAPGYLPPLPYPLPAFAATSETAAGQNARMARAAVLAPAGIPVDALSAQAIGVVLAASSPNALLATDGAERTSI